MKKTALALKYGLLLLFILYSALSCRLFQMQPLGVVEWSPSAKTVASADDVHIWLTFSSPVDRTRVEEAFSLTENGENMEVHSSGKMKPLPSNLSNLSPGAQHMSL